MRIAVVGSGAAGLAAAWTLSAAHEVVLYEAANRPGGHCNTIEAPGPDGPIPVDTGFIVFNNVNYPNLVRLFDHLGVDVDNSDMSFGISVDRGRVEWSGDNIGTVFSQRGNLLRPRFLRMVADILRFNRRAVPDLEAGRLAGLSLGDYLGRDGYGRGFHDWYLLPMGAAIWSTSLAEMLDFPAETFVRFFHNHALLSVDGQHQWRTLRARSRDYVARLLQAISGEIRLSCPVAAVEPTPDGPVVIDASGQRDRFDHVVIGAHGDQALRMLAAPTAEQRDILGAFAYSRNRAFLHGDAELMPRRRAVWSSWNYLRDSTAADDSLVTLTYWMNRLQNIDPSVPLFVSLNPVTPPRDELVHAEVDYEHPLFTARAIAAQPLLADIQGQNGLWFCGSYHGYGFHEDAFASGLRVAARLGVQPPWISGARRPAAAAQAELLDA